MDPLSLPHSLLHHRRRHNHPHPPPINYASPPHPINYASPPPVGGRCYKTISTIRRKSIQTRTTTTIHTHTTPPPPPAGGGYMAETELRVVPGRHGADHSQRQCVLQRTESWCALGHARAIQTDTIGLTRTCTYAIQTCIGTFSLAYVYSKGHTHNTQ